jgi:hypothetical protein
LKPSTYIPQAQFLPFPFVCSSTELKFLEAQKAYNLGKPIMSDSDFDKLKYQLRQSGSIIGSQGARCSIRSRKMYSDAKVDYARMVALNIPAALLVLLGVFSIDDLTGFEFTKVVELPEPYGILVVWGLVLPVIYVLSSAITNVLFRDALILRADCPSCGTENMTFFGDILTVAGNRDKNTIECSNCKAKLAFNASSREVVVESEPAAPKKEKVAA